MKYPFLILLTPYVLGILLSSKIKLDLYLMIIAILLVIYLHYTTISRKSNQIIVVIIIFFLLAMINSSDDNLSILKRLESKSYTYEGKIIEEKSQKNQFIIEISKVNGHKINKEKMLLNIYDLDKNNDQNNFKLKLGKKIKFQAELKIPEANTNPRLFNYRQYLKSKKIYTSASIGYQDMILSHARVDSLSAMRSGFKEGVETTFKKYLSDENARLMSAIVLGDTSLIDERKRESYNDLGLAHVLAVSGLHLSILSLALNLILSKLGIRKNINYIISLVFIWVYGYLIFYPASIVRASLVLTFIYISRILSRPYNKLNILSLAMLLSLFKNPYLIYSLGFILSFAASYSLIIFIDFVSLNLRAGPIKNKYIVDCLAGILAVQLGLFPIEAYYFNQFKVLAYPGNLLIVPLMSLSLLIGFSILFLEFFFSAINNILGSVLGMLLNSQASILYSIGRFKALNLDLASPSPYLLIAYYAFIALALNLRRLRKIDIKTIKIVNIFLIISIIVNGIAIYINDDIEVHFIDVGQGDACLIRDGSKNYLIDTGGDVMKGQNVGKNISLPYLKKLGIKKIDSLFISHFHEDHYGALFDIAADIEIEKIYASYPPEDKKLRKLINKNKIRFEILEAGDSLNLGKNLKLLNLWPQDQELQSLGDNNMSMCSYIKAHKTSLLFTGDIEKEAESQLIEGLGDLKLDLIKVPHHGSGTSSTEEFLEKIAPKNAVISVGRKNMFNHPAEEVVERYQIHGSKLYRTDQDGMVYIKINRQGYEIIPFLEEKQDKPSIMDIIAENSQQIIFILATYVILYRVVKRKLPRGEDLFAL